jgi:predicted N-formylglutamate amidohydrolase
MIRHLERKLTEARSLFNSFQRGVSGGSVIAPVHNVVLGDWDGPAVWIENEHGMGTVLVVCDHASNRIPQALCKLGMTPDALASHVAWDPGAYAVAGGLARLLDAPLISANFSRLVYDVNRPPHSPEAMRATSEIYEIPGNRDLPDAAREARTAALYLPFHRAIRQLLDARDARMWPTALVTIHSFTAIYHGEQRDMELGVLHDEDPRLADRLLDVAVRDGTLITRRNEPYGPEDGVTHTLRLHAIPRGLPNVMIEIRNDLIGETASQARMALRLADMLRKALSGLSAPMNTPSDEE